MSQHFTAFCSLALCVFFFSQESVDAQEATESAAPLDDQGHLIDFKRDIAPILRAHCIECHGPEDAKNDFRADESSLLDYVEPDDADSSTLFVDYLVAEDQDQLMPPPSHGGPLAPAELALIRVWINEGALWPDDFVIGSALSEPQKTSPASPEPKGIAIRAWMFQGFFHPATVHFPIAMLLIGGLFVVLGWKWPAIGTQVPLACLLIGAASSIVASAMGWSFATQQGYGSWTSVNTDSEIFWHRWSAMIVTVLSSFFAIIAIMATVKKKANLNWVWKTGLLVVAGMVGAVGHQGGELTYGHDFYPKAIRILLGQPEPSKTIPLQDAQPSEKTAAETE